MTNKEKLLEKSKEMIGKEASPYDNAPDEFGCVESLCSIIRSSIARDFPLELATWKFLTLLKQDKRFKTTLELEPGNIILSPTGSGNGTVRGHTGIIGEDGTIMSNNSYTGLWESNYTINTWVERWRVVGGMPIYVFEPIGDYSVDKPVEIKEKVGIIIVLLDKIKEILSSLI
jgi:hypothetical protein